MNRSAVRLVEDAAFIMHEPDPSNPLPIQEQIACCWTQAQPAVRAFLFAVVRDPAAVDDLLQEVALTIVRRFDQFEPGTNFTAWAVTIARHKVMDFHKTRARDRHVHDERVVARLADAHVEVEHEIGPRRQALEHCLEKLPDRHRQLLARRYEDNESVSEIAESEGANPNAIAVLLHRVRLALRQCIERQLMGDQP